MRAPLPPPDPEPRYRELVDRVGAIVYEAVRGTAPGDTRFLFVSDGARTLLGFSPERLVAEPALWQRTIHPDDLERAVEEIREAVAADGPVSFEYRQRTAAGDELWMRNVVDAEVQPDGSVRFSGVVVDITESRRAAERLLRVRRATDELSATLTAAEVAQVVAAQGRVAVDAVAVAVFVREGDAVRPLGYDGHADVGLPEDCVVGLDRDVPVAIAVRKSEPVLVGVPEPTHAPAGMKEGRLLAGDGPLVVLPMLAGTDGAAGALAVRLAPGATVQDADRTLLEVLARTAGQALARTEVLEAERAARQRAEETGVLLDTLISTAPEGYALFDRDLRYVRCNQALAEMNGVPVEEHLGRTVAEVIPDVPIGELLREVLDTGRRYVDLEVSGRDAVGREHVWLVSYYPVRDAAGAIRWVGAFVVDITARKRAERRTTLLAELGSILGETTTVEERLRRVASALTGAFADFSTVYLHEGHAGLRRVATRHVDPELERRLEANPPSGGMLLRPAVLDFEDMSEDDYEAVAADPIARANHRAAGTRHILIVPMLLGGEHLGAIAVASRRARAFDELDRGFLQEVALRAALSIDNARLLRAERDARDRTERQYAVAAALADALTPEEVGDALLGELLPAIDADVALLWRLSDDGSVLEVIGRRGLTAAEQPGGDRMPTTDPLPAARALRERRARWAATADEIVTVYPEADALVARLGLESLGAVPLLAAGRAVGALAVGARHAHAFSGEDRALTMTAAVQAAQAIERAGLFDTARRTSVTLQRSLLPAHLPELAGLELGLRYLPAAGLEAGGDFYEALPIGDEGEVLVAVGDVVGRGATAAAAMGQLRSALRAFAQVLHEPEPVLERLSGFADGVGGAMAATAVVATLLPATGELRYACAGHPYPLLVSPDGDAAFLQEGRSVPLGCVPGPEYPVAHARVAPGGTLLLYTDGLTERRGTDLTLAMEKLRAAAAAAAGDPLEALLDAVVAAMGDDDPGDDVAIVGVRLTQVPTDRRVTFPAQLSQVPTARALVRTWLAELGVSGDPAADVLLAAGEAFANAVEHSGADEVTLALTSPAPGVLGVEVQDAGRWRPPPAVTSRGRGVAMMRALVDDFTLDTTERGTRVRLRHTVAARGAPAPPAETAPGCRVTLEQGVARLEGALDIASAATVAARLAAAAPSGLVVDLSAVDFLDSTGARLLLELGEAGDVTVVAPPGSAPRRTLELSGLAAVLRLRDA